jgi:transposase InsO family protein
VSRYRFIAAQKASYSVARMCRVLQVAPSGYYAWCQDRVSPRAQANRVLLEQIGAIHQRSHGTYGAPRVHAELRDRKQHVSRKRVARLMRSAGLVGRPPRRFRRTTVADQHVQAEDLVQRQFTATAPDQIWFGDITYIRTWQGWLYLAVLLDAYSRKVVGWAMADHLRTELASSALHMALRSRRPASGLIHHTDRGVQYTSVAYRQVLAAHQVRPSVGKPGTCWDNAVAESFFATLKNELVHRHTWSTHQQAKQAIFEFIAGWYNQHRRHSALGYRSPAAVEQRTTSAPLAA